jgi:leader peptidase (prepilin peptidase) / N-methyltransferase
VAGNLGRYLEGSEGAVGFSALIAGGFARFLLAAVYGIALLTSGRATRKHQIPSGPFMIAGAFLAILAWHLPT